MDDVNNIIPGVAGAAGTGAVMIAVLKMFLSNWLAKADKTAELVGKIDKDLAVMGNRVERVEKDITGIAQSFRTKLDAIAQKQDLP